MDYSTTSSFHKGFRRLARHADASDGVLELDRIGVVVLTIVFATLVVAAAVTERRRVRETDQ